MHKRIHTENADMLTMLTLKDEVKTERVYTIPSLYLPTMLFIINRKIHYGI